MTPTPDGMPEFHHTPVNRHLGFRLVSRDADACVVEMDPRPEVIQESGHVHGGVLAALADTASVYILFPHLPPGFTLTSIEFKMNFLKPVAAGTGAIQAHARKVQRGKKVGLTEVDVLQNNRLMAKGLFTYLFFPVSGDASSTGR